MSGPTAGQTSSVTADEEAEQKTALLDPSVEGTVIEEAVPASRRRRPRQHGDRPLLEVNGLKTSFYTRDGVVRAVDGINFHVDSRRDHGPGRRERLRQERDEPVDPAARREPRPDRGRRRSCSTATTC